MRHIAVCILAIPLILEVIDALKENGEDSRHEEQVAAYNDHEASCIDDHLDQRVEKLRYRALQQEEAKASEPADDHDNDHVVVQCLLLAAVHNLVNRSAGYHVEADQVQDGTDYVDGCPFVYRQLHLSEHVEEYFGYQVQHECSAEDRSVKDNLVVFVKLVLGDYVLSVWGEVLQGVYSEQAEVLKVDILEEHNHGHA
jgi:hypothetical protein